MAVDHDHDHDHDSYYPYKQPGSVPFNWEIRPGVPKHNPNPNHNTPLPPQTTTRITPKLKPPPPISLYHPLEEPRTRSFLSAPRTRSILSSSTASPRAHSQRIVSSSSPTGPELVGPGCFPSTPKQGRVSSGRGSRRRSTGRSKRVDSELGFDFGPDYGSDLEILVRWSSAISSMRKSNAAFHYSSPDSSSTSSQSPVSHAEWAALNLF